MHACHAPPVPGYVINTHLMHSTLIPLMHEFALLLKHISSKTHVRFYSIELQTDVSAIPSMKELLSKPLGLAGVCDLRKASGDR